MLALLKEGQSVELPKERQQLVAKTISVCLKCALPIFELDGVSPLHMPDIEDPSFQVAKTLPVGTHLPELWYNVPHRRNTQ